MAGVIRVFGARYFAAYGKGMPSSHRKALASIERCRTPLLGGHVVQCDGCSVQEFVYHSCRHRSCPKCGRAQNDAWFAARESELLPVPYFHVVFTVPEKLHKVIRRYQKWVYPLMLRAAAETLQKFGRNPEHMGGDIGGMTVLHTWTRTLMYHPHVHCLVPAVYLGEGGEVALVRRPRLASQRALAKVFKGKLLAMMRAEVVGLHVPRSADRSKWIAHVDVARQGSDIVLKYLSRYVNRTALSDHRIISVTQTDVTFKYQTKDRKSWLTMKVSGLEFLRRFLQHVLPKGIQKIRYFGFWSRTRRADLARIRAKLAELQEQGALRPNPSVRVPSAVATPAAADAEPKWLECPHCKAGRRIVVRHFGPCTEPPQFQQYPGLPPPRPPP